MATVFLKVARYSLKERIIIDHNIIITIIYKLATAPKAHYIVHILVKIYKMNLCKVKPIKR